MKRQPEEKKGCRNKSKVREKKNEKMIALKRNAVKVEKIKLKYEKKNSTLKKMEIVQQ